MNSLSSQALLEIVSPVDLHNLMEGGRANFKFKIMRQQSGCLHQLLYLRSEDFHHASGRPKMTAFYKNITQVNVIDK